MVTNYIKKVAGLFAVLLLVSVVGISLPATNVNANEVKEVNICDYQVDPGDNGLIKDAVVHDKTEMGTFFKTESDFSTFAENVVVDVDSSFSIKSQTDLENFYVSGAAIEKGLHIMALSSVCSGKREIVAVSTVTEQVWKNSFTISSGYADVSQKIKNKLGIQKYLDVKAATESKNQTLGNAVNSTISSTEPGKPVENKVGDPDGSCSNAFVCLNHKDGGSGGADNFPHFFEPLIMLQELS